jgi:hypothetical protein
MSSLSLLTI